jgi:hypothetical protein
MALTMTTPLGIRLDLSIMCACSEALVVLVMDRTIWTCVPIKRSYHTTTRMSKIYCSDQRGASASQVGRYDALANGMRSLLEPNFHLHIEAHRTYQLC